VPVAFTSAHIGLHFHRISFKAFLYADASRGGYSSPPL
jgi:hypothetical protein